jgi:putative transcriptional regulator
MLYQYKGDNQVGRIVNRVSVVAGERRMKVPDIAEKGGLYPDVVWRHWHGRAKRIDLETLAGLCKGLDCQPGDLFIYIPNSEGDK